MRVATATGHFFHSFHNFFPELEVIDPKKKNVDDFNLVIFTGGEDINPRYYGQENTHSSYNDMRDDVETSILRQCLHYQIKILGVCRGHQLINAYLGGDMVQDIYLDTNEYHESNHSLKFNSTSSLIKYLYDGKKVNSLHHQGVTRQGRNLKVTSTYKGIIESCESPDIFTVQFHPEFMDDEEFFNTVKLWVENRDLLLEKISKSKKTNKLEDLVYNFNSSSTSTWGNLTIEQEERLRENIQRLRMEVGTEGMTRVVLNPNFEFTRQIIPPDEELNDEELLEIDDEFLDHEDN